MSNVPKTISIDGVEYVQANNQKPAETLNGLEYKIVRTQSAGVFAGFIKSRNGREVEVLQARRIFYWSGAASLSQLAIDGTSKPNDCKFPESVSKVMLLEVIEILDVTEKAKKSIESVKVWKA